MKPIPEHVDQFLRSLDPAQEKILRDYIAEQHEEIGQLTRATALVDLVRETATSSITSTTALNEVRSEVQAMRERIERIAAVAELMTSKPGKAVFVGASNLVTAAMAAASAYFYATGGASGP